jgi:hypothetical protein
MRCIAACFRLLCYTVYLECFFFCPAPHSVAMDLGEVPDAGGLPQLRRTGRADEANPYEILWTEGKKVT